MDYQPRDKRIAALALFFEPLLYDIKSMRFFACLIFALRMLFVSLPGSRNRLSYVLSRQGRASLYFSTRFTRRIRTRASASTCSRRRLR